MLLFLLISYFFSLKVKSQKRYLSLNAFGFLNDSKFEFNLTNAMCKQIFVGLANPNELNSISSILLEHNNYSCQSIKRSLYVVQSVLVDINKNKCGYFNGTIDKDIYLTPLIISCSSENLNSYQTNQNSLSNIESSKNRMLLNIINNENSMDGNDKSTSYISDYTLSVRFTNPDSLLDSRKIPCLYIKPVSTALFGILIIFWLGNWFLNFTLKNPLHLYLTVTFLVTFVFVIVDTLKLYHDNVSDDPTPLSTAVIVLRCFHELLLLTAMMFAAKGWCIIIESIPIIEIFSTFFYSIMFSIPILILDTQVMNVYIQIAMFIAGFTGCFLYYNVLITSIAEANSVVSAHLLIISQSGIDPETTPIQKKFQIFNTISNSVVLYFSIMMFRAILYELLQLPDFIMISVYDFATLILLSIAAWLFKLKKSLRTGYMMVGETANSVEFTLDDIEKLNEDRDELQKNATTPWQEGMPLPAQPIVHKNPSKNINNIDEKDENNKNNKNINNINDDNSSPLNMDDDKKERKASDDKNNS